MSFFPSFQAFATVAAVAVLEFSWVAACGAQSLPEPTGPHSVGRITYHLVDAARNDDQGSHKDHKREFMVHVWYPAQPDAKGKLAPWMPADWARLEEKGILGMRLKNSSDPAAKDIPGALAAVRVHACEGVPLAAAPKRFPVLVFSPGSLMFPSEYSSLVEDLASRGYVVIGNVPTGYVAAVSFPEGNITRSFKKPNFPLWTGDLTHMLARLEAWNTTPGHLFHGRLDFDKVGAFGHSAGGKAVATIAGREKRLKAIALLDPGMEGTEETPAIPTLLLRSTSGLALTHPEAARAKAKLWAKYMKGTKPAIQIALVGAEHLSFTDMAVLKAFALRGDGKAFIATTRAVLAEFFGQYLLGKHSELLQKGSANYPLAKIESQPQ